LPEANIKTRTIYMVKKLYVEAFHSTSGVALKDAFAQGKLLRNHYHEPPPNPPNPIPSRPPEDSAADAAIEMWNGKDGRGLR